jgi:microcystin-dependent protein
MKKHFYKIIALLLIVNYQLSTINCKAQNIPSAVNFQAVARNASNQIVANATIEARITITQGNAGPTLRQLTFQKTTDAYGQFTLSLSEGDASSSSGPTPFNNIDWSTGDKWLRVEFRPNLVDAFTLISNTQSSASFYAFSARTAEELKTTGANGQVLKHNGTTWVAGTDDNGGPAGGLIAFTGTTAPTGWLLCDGSQVSRTTYAALFAVIGTAYGAGDGSTTFHLPDLRGRFVRGLDGTANNDPDKATRTASNTGGNTGNNLGSLQNDEFKAHRHSIRRDNNSGTQTYGIESPSKGAGVDEFAYTDEAGGSTETRPKNIYVNYIIKH